MSIATFETELGFKATVYEAEQGYTVRTFQSGEHARSSLSNRDDKDKAIAEFQRVVVEALQQTIVK